MYALTGAKKVIIFHFGPHAQNIYIYYSKYLNIIRGLLSNLFAFEKLYWSHKKINLSLVLLCLYALYIGIVFTESAQRPTQSSGCNAGLWIYVSYRA